MCADEGAADLLYCIAFAARFAIGDWTLLGPYPPVSNHLTHTNQQYAGKCQARVENLSGTLSTSHPSPPDFSSTSASASASTGPSMPSGDDVFGPSMDRVRLDMIDAMCEGLDRMGCVWETGNKVRPPVPLLLYYTDDARSSCNW
jgi:hypothetical protein